MSKFFLFRSNFLNTSIFLWINVLFVLVSFAQNTQENTATSSFQKQFNEYDLSLQDKKYDVAINAMNEVAKKAKGLELVVAYANLADAFLLKQDYEKSNHYLNEAKNLVENTSSIIDDAYYYHIRGRIFYRKQQNEDAIKYLYESIKILEKLPNQDIMLAYNYYYLADIHAKIRIYSDDYRKYIQQNIKYALKTNNLQLILMSYAAQSLFYETAYNKFGKKEDLDSLFTNSEKLLKLVNENVGKGLVSNRIFIIYYNNMATYINNYNYRNYSKYERAKIAEDYIKKGIDIAIKDKTHHDLLGYCYLTYGEIQTNLGNEGLVETYFLKAYDIVNEYGTDNLFVRRIISRYLSDFYKKKGNYNLALDYKTEELNFSKESYDQLIDDKKKYLEAYYNFEQQNQKIEQLEEKNSFYRKQVVMYIVLIVLAIVGIIFLTYTLVYRAKINKQKTELLEAEKQEAELTLQLEIKEKARLKAEQELLALQQEQLHKKALATSLKLEKKNTLINELKSKVNPNVNLNLLLKQDKLTDDDFNEIQNIVEEVHPNFYKKLNSISAKKLTNQDLKYAAYIYLNMSNAQIANVLKVDVNTVRMTKYRLKQKLGIDKEVDLQQFIQNLDL